MTAEQRNINKIIVELRNAEIQHADYPDDMFIQVAIMNEEAGEATKAVLHYHYEGAIIEDVEKELIQTAAMCLRMLNYHFPFEDLEDN